MKKRNLVLFAVLLAFCFVSVKAQNKIGIRAGYQCSNWADKDGARLGDPLNSFYVGLFKENKLIPALHFGIGFEYFQNGYKGSNTDNKQVLHILSVPVYAKVKIGPVFALGGLAGNFKVSEKVIFDGNSASPTDAQKSKSVDIPVFLGAGLKITIFTIEARYHWGLIAVNQGLYNRYVQIGAAVSF
jgi:hypothetical protein